MSWAPQQLPPAGDDLVQRLRNLYLHTDPAMAQALDGRKQLLDIARAGDMDAMTPRAGAELIGMARTRAYFTEAAGTTGKYLAQAEGPRVGALAFNGWDTHINEGASSGFLADLLNALDGAIGAIETNMATVWRDTVIAIVTEFGRTARINGTDGTDHGTGTVALLIGGALKGGRVIADWPGVKDGDLYEGRDLKATADLRAVLKGLLRDHLRLDERALAVTVFPESATAKPMTGLVAAG
jgi:uncharacterized protein (DUF1501 family)